MKMTDDELGKYDSHIPAGIRDRLTPRQRLVVGSVSVLELYPEETLDTDLPGILNHYALCKKVDAEYDSLGVSRVFSVEDFETIISIATKAMDEHNGQLPLTLPEDQLAALKRYSRGYVTRALDLYRFAIEVERCAEAVKEMQRK